MHIRGYFGGSATLQIRVLRNLFLRMMHRRDYNRTPWRTRAQQTIVRAS
jgi:hypothetical protein